MLLFERLPSITTATGSYPQDEVQILFNFRFGPDFLNDGNVLQPVSPSKWAGIP